MSHTNIRVQVMTVLMLVIITFSACSKGKQPIIPSENEIPFFSLTETESNRSVIAIYDAIIDPVTQNFTITPCDRELSGHFELSKYFPSTLSITGYGFSPVFWADIKISHPFPGSGIDVFDPRVIAVIPANPGVSFNYPVMAANGNNKAVIDPDGYTKLFDATAGAYLGNTNPFRAYFKSDSYRRWSSVGTTSETQRWYMNLAGFGGPTVYKLILDVATNYPSAPQPIIDNAPEPVRINTFVSTGLTQSGGNASVEVTLLDWQGRTGITAVACECPSLFNGVTLLSYLKPGDTNE